MVRPIQPAARSRRLWIWVGYWVCLFVVMHVPMAATGPATVPHADKVAHAVLYFVLAALGGRYLMAVGRVSRLAVITWAIVYAAYAALDEWLQSFVHRSMSLQDWVADLVGIAAGTVLVLWLAGRVPTRSEPNAPGR
jgi:VanZ family protein